MNPIDNLFANGKAKGHKAFIPFLPAGDPDLAFTAAALPVLAQAGASLIEVGVPFSDPIADGPVIQASYTRALDRGFKVKDLFATLKSVTATPGWNTPIVTMASYTLIHRMGAKAFISAAQDAGVTGAVIPDLPVEESGELSAMAKDRDFKMILLVTPTTTAARAEQIVKACTGFVYVVSIVGITGARTALPEELQGLLQRLRGMTDLPLCVGFGVSTPEHVKALKPIADGVIVGSALAKLLPTLDTNEARATSLNAIAALAGQLAAPLVN